jgi:hypothetical protein
MSSGKKPRRNCCCSVSGICFGCKQGFQCVWWVAPRLKFYPPPPSLSLFTSTSRYLFPISLFPTSLFSSVLFSTSLSLSSTSFFLLLCFPLYCFLRFCFLFLCFLHTSLFQLLYFLRFCFIFLCFLLLCFDLFIL